MLNTIKAEDPIPCYFHQNDDLKNSKGYSYLVWLTEHKYTGSLSGEKKEVTEKLAKQPWYINVALFKGNNHVNTASFPASLLVFQDNHIEAKPKFICFLGEWNYIELLCIETVNGVDQLVKYLLWAEEGDTKNSPPIMSVDYGKRILAYSGRQNGNLDPSYVPLIGQEGNIYFKAGEENKYKQFKWNIVTESTSRQDKEQDRKNNSNDFIPCNMNEQKIEVNKGQFELSSNIEVTFIDPLDVNEKKITAPYQNYGTESNPLSKNDYKILNETGQLAPGAILVLNKLNAIVTEDKLIEEQEKELQVTVANLAETYQKKKNVIRELKLLFREYGPKGKLKKRFSNIEVKSIINGLSNTHGGVQNIKNKGHVEINNDKIIIPLDYYRILKSLCNRGFRKEDFEDQSQLINLKKAVLDYPKSVMQQQNTLEKTINEFLQLKDQKNWALWFEKENKNIMIELLCDYLVQCEEKELSNVFLKRLSKITAIATYKNIIQIYRNSNISPVKK